MILRERELGRPSLRGGGARPSAEADGTLEERTPPLQSYFLQNWRADVVGLVSASGGGGEPIQQMRYEPYGVAFGLPKCDLDGDGDVDAADDTLFDALHAASNIRADWDFDGDFDAADTTAFVADHAADADLGRGAPSYDAARAGGAVRKLYAGYEHDPALAGETYHVRHRVLLAELGRWSRRDPLGYVDGWSLYQYVASRAVAMADVTGQTAHIQNDSGADSDCVDRTWTYTQCATCCGDDHVNYMTCMQSCSSAFPPGDPRQNPDLNPDNWTPDGSLGNCWRYAMCRPLSKPVGTNCKTPDHNRLPGDNGGTQRWNYSCDCDKLKAAMETLATPAGKDEPCEPDCYKVFALLTFIGIDPFSPGNPARCDPHFFRQDPDGSWSDKEGCRPATRGIADPEAEVTNRCHAGRDSYCQAEPCGPLYYCVCIADH